MICVQFYMNSNRFNPNWIRNTQSAYIHPPANKCQILWDRIVVMWVTHTHTHTHTSKYYSRNMIFTLDYSKYHILFNSHSYTKNYSNGFRSITHAHFRICRSCEPCFSFWVNIQFVTKWSTYKLHILTYNMNKHKAI